MPNSMTITTSTAEAVIGLTELASVLGTTPERIKRNWLNWHSNKGMPRKHPLFWTWPRASMNIWLTSQGIVDPIAGNDNTGELPECLHDVRVSEQREGLYRALGLEA